MRFLPSPLVFVRWILVATAANLFEVNGETTGSTTSVTLQDQNQPIDPETVKYHEATKQPLLSLGPLQILGVLIKPTNQAQSHGNVHDTPSSVSTLQRVFDERGDLNVDEYIFTTPSYSTRSYLLLLAGNCTVVRLRQKDFAKYLKLNLAARLSLEYDDVKINQVILAPPRLVVNVSVLELTPDGTKENAALERLAEANATLLELSGEEYRVLRLLPQHFNEIDLKQYILSHPNVGISQSIFIFLGGICLTIFISTLLKQAMHKYKNTWHITWLCAFKPFVLSSWHSSPRNQLISINESSRNQYSTPPTISYSGSFSVGGLPTQWNQDYQSTNIEKCPTPFSIDINTCHTVNPSKLHIFGCRSDSIVGYPATHRLG